MNNNAKSVQIKTMQIEIIKEKSAQVASAERRLINGSFKSIDKNLTDFFEAIEQGQKSKTEKKQTR